MEEIIQYINNCIHIQFRTTQDLRKKLVRFLQYCGSVVNGYSVSHVVRAFILWQLDAACKHLQPVHIKEKMQEYLKQQPKRGRPWGSPNQR